MAYLTGDDLIARVKSVLAIEAMDTPTNWTQVCADAAAMAAADIRGILAKRGFSGAQIAAWDSLAAFNASQGLYWALTLGGATKDFDDTFIRQLDRREQLMTVDVTAGEESVSPAEPLVAGGTLSQADDAFRPDDTDLARWGDAADLGNGNAGKYPWR